MKQSYDSVAVAITKLLFDTHNCRVDSDVGTGDFSFVLGILHVCGHAHAPSHMAPGMD